MGQFPLATHQYTHLSDELPRPFACSLSAPLQKSVFLSPGTLLDRPARICNQPNRWHHFYLAASQVFITQLSRLVASKKRFVKEPDIYPSANAHH